MGEQEKTLLDSLTEKNEIKRLSPVSSEEHAKQKEKVKTILSKTNLTDKEKGILKTRYGEDNIRTYTSISNTYGLSISKT